MKITVWSSPFKRRISTKKFFLLDMFVFVYAWSGLSSIPDSLIQLIARHRPHHESPTASKVRSQIIARPFRNNSEKRSKHILKNTRCTKTDKRLSTAGFTGLQMITCPIPLPPSCKAVATSVQSTGSISCHYGRSPCRQGCHPPCHRPCRPHILRQSSRWPEVS